MEEGELEIYKEKELEEGELEIYKEMEEEEEVGCTGVTECLLVVCVAGSFHQTVLASNPRNQV